MHSRVFLAGLLALSFAALVIGIARMNGPGQAVATGETGRLEGIDQLVTGVTHGCALLDDDSVYCWGSNSSGQLGEGCTGDHCTRPTKVEGLDGNNIVSIASGPGSYHNCAVLDDGTAKCWGENGDGQLGDGTYEDRAIPVTVCASITNGTCNPLQGVVAIAAGKQHTCALVPHGENDYAAKCWGDGSRGQLGNKDWSDSLMPVDVCATLTFTAGCSGGNRLSAAGAIAAGSHHTCVRFGATSGSMACWGNNDHGQLGDGSTTTRNHPVDVCISGSGWACGSGGELLTGVTTFGAGGYLFLNLFEGHTCALVAAAGEVYCWGNNNTGQVGNGSFDDAVTRPTRVCASGTGGTCTVLTGVSAIGVGSTHTCAVLAGGEVGCWGYDNYGQLGDGTPGIPGDTDSQVNPVSVCRFYVNDACATKLDGQKALALSYGTSCSVTQNDTAMCWAWNQNGAIGDGTYCCPDPRDEDAYIRARPVDVLLERIDTDGDGCLDIAEVIDLPGSEYFGGKRDPNSDWDFFDTWEWDGEKWVRDGIITSEDADRVSQRTGYDGTPGDPDEAPQETPGSPGYHSAFDRGAAAQGNEPWQLEPANGQIRIGDVTVASSQAGYDCR